ncbi:MAG: type I restriction endonuclease [Ignavibacterium sp.]|nr:type I restriction endonuclease [Ignavibacterium sp.]
MQDVIQIIQKNISEGFFTNEAAVIRGIINPILQSLDWPINDVRIVRPEYTVEGQRVDLALFYNNKPFIFIEAKKIGAADGTERQLFEYAFHTGVPILILTDGPTWHFFLTAGLGNYEQRKVAKLDLMEYDDLEQLITKFKDYLEFNNVISGKSLLILQKEYTDINREREILQTIPLAWEKIVEEEEDLLFELIATKVEELCNYKPNKQAVFNFLKNANQTKEISIKKTVPVKETIETHTKIKIKPSGSLGFTRIKECIFGNEHPGNRWANLISCGLKIAVRMGLSFTDIQRNTTINLVRGEQHDRGFKFVPQAGISYQGMDANRTWENALKLAQLTKQKIYVKFEWTNNPNSRYPGREEILYWEP